VIVYKLIYVQTVQQNSLQIFKQNLRSSCNWRRARW